MPGEQDDSTCSPCSALFALYFFRGSEAAQEPSRDEERAYQAPGPVTTTPPTGVAMSTHSPTGHAAAVRLQERNRLLPKQLETSTSQRALAELGRGGEPAVSTSASAASPQPGGSSAAADTDEVELHLGGGGSVTSASGRGSGSSNGGRPGGADGGGGGGGAAAQGTGATGHRRVASGTSSTGSHAGGNVGKGGGAAGHSGRLGEGHRRTASSTESRVDRAKAAMAAAAFKYQHLKVSEGAHVSPRGGSSRGRVLADPTWGPAAGADGKVLVPQEEDDDFCPTCLEDYTEENPKIWTQCAHHFHMPCIFEWMERKDTCPMCESKMVFPDLE